MPLVFVQKIGRPIDHDSFVIDVPAGLGTKSGLMEVLSAGGKFPEYFGRNWDALNDCLNDFSWIKNPRIVIAHRDLPLSNDWQACHLYLKILVDAAGDDRLVVEFPLAIESEVRAVLAIPIGESAKH